MSDYVEVENLPKANELINDDYVLINQNEDDAKVDMGTIKEFVRPPNASPTESGLVSTAEQTFSGKKNFTEIASNKATISSLNSHNANLTEATIQDLHITGNLIQDGETIETEVETLKVKDQVIVTRSGATTGMTDGEVTGIVAEKYDGQNNGVLIFGSDGVARVGDEGDAQPLATREETPNNGSIQIWDEQTRSFKSFPFGQKGQYLRQGENGLEYGSAVAVDGTASEKYVDNKVQEEATLRQNAIEELDAKKTEISDTTTSTTSTWSSSKIAQQNGGKQVFFASASNYPTDFWILTNDTTGVFWFKQTFSRDGTVKVIEGYANLTNDTVIVTTNIGEITPRISTDSISGKKGVKIPIPMIKTDIKITEARPITAVPTQIINR